MHIHFVCSGNAYRSRLAEAYTKSKIVGRDIIVSSSGISVDENKFANGPICWYAMRIMKRRNLISYMAWHERQTTKDILDKVDLLVCMQQEHLDYCQKKLGYTGQMVVWDIVDLDKMKGFMKEEGKDYEKDINHIELTEKTYSLITQKSDNLLFNLEKKPVV